VNTGVQCTIDPQCRQPAPPETGICSCHQREIRLGQMRRSPSPGTRAIGHALTHLLAGRDREAEAG
jgi:hypothetical protein